MKTKIVYVSSSIGIKESEGDFMQATIFIKRLDDRRKDGCGGRHYYASEISRHKPSKFANRLQRGMKLQAALLRRELEQ